ncbi:MAG: OB-fold nucleic acid binding domain-containing protein, partial [Rhodospirillales bacterium]|nr:OB-fold nucleic acid binding domain-containing protein [Rhodospirillales bacterium]
AETLIRHAAAAASERESAQVNLFGGDAAEQHARLALPEVEDWPAVERLRHEFEAIGFYLSAHPLDAYGGTLGRLRVTSYAELSARSGTDSGRKRLAGIVIGKQERTSRQGNRFAFVQLSDTSGMFEIIVFSELLAGARDLLDSGQPLLVTVSLDRRDNGEAPRLTAQEIAPLDQAVAQAGTDLKLFLSDPAPLDSLKAVLRREAVAGGRGRVALVLGLDGGREVEMELPGGYRLSAQVRQAIKAIPGVVVQEI